MNTDASHQTHDRREFLKVAIPLGCLSCLLGPAQLSASPDESQTLNPQDHKFKADSHMSYERVFRCAYRTWLIPYLKNLADQIGKDQFIEMLKKAALAVGEEEGKALSKKHPDNELRTYADYFESRLTKPGFTNSVLSHENFKKSEKSVSVRITECLYAKTFRDADAADLGYAVACSQEHGFFKGYNSKIKVTRPQTLMQGDECCNIEYTQEA